MKRPGFSRRRSAPAFLRILFITLTLSGCEIDDRNPELTDLEWRLSRVVDVPMEVDASRLPPFKTIMRRVLSQKEKIEKLVEEKGQPYVIVRPGGLTDEKKPESVGVVKEAPSKLWGKVSRQTLSTVIVDLIENKEAHNKTWECIEI